MGRICVSSSTAILTILSSSQTSEPRHRPRAGIREGPGLAHEHPAPSGCAELGVPPLVLTVQEARWLGQNGISGVKRVRSFLIGKLSGSELTATTN